MNNSKKGSSSLWNPQKTKEKKQTMVLMGGEYK